MHVDRLARIVSARCLALDGDARAIREAAGLSQGEVAAELGVHPSAVSLWERGRRVPRGENAEVYAVLLARLRRQIAARERAAARAGCGGAA